MADANPVEELPNELTPATPEQIAVALVRAWRALWNETPTRESLLVLLAQGAFETGWWKSCHCWNLGNAKSIVGDGHCYTYFACSEVLGGKVVWFYPPHPASRFRAFRSLVEGAVDYLSLLRRRFSQAWPFVLTGDPVQFVHALKAQGYFTDSEAHYSGQVSAIWKAMQVRFAAFDPASVPDATDLTDEERAAIMARVAASLADMTRDLMNEREAEGPGEDPVA